MTLVNEADENDVLECDVVNFFTGRDHIVCDTRYMVTTVSTAFSGNQLMHICLIFITDQPGIWSVTQGTRLECRLTMEVGVVLKRSTYAPSARSL